PVITVDDRQQTTVPGVYAAGDAARSMHNVAFAVSDGAFAGVCAHQSLVFG
ncbi:MAG: NAD(P)/FAD-dependent oxidoreductase, partial [Mesorhizobium sp.]